MTIELGSKVPAVQLLQRVGETFVSVDLAERLAGRRVVIFGLPGAFTGTCTAAHVPSFIRTRAALADAGVDEVICISVNDPWVMQAWGASTGAEEAGITMLADAAADYAKATGLVFTAPGAGFYDRIVRHALFAQDRVVKVLNVEEQRGTCDLTSGETMLAAIEALPDAATG